MLFSEIKPFVRYARYLYLDQTTLYESHIPLDARLFYVTNGCGQICISDNIYTLEKGDLLLINSGIEYHLMVPERSASYLAINFDYTDSHAALSVPIPPKVKKFFPKSSLLNR